MLDNKTHRCAIYTRKSTEDGLEQDFNSLQAQREACEAYIASQASLGWKLLKTDYDDGGISGGTMERPALQELLEEIKSGRIDVVVVYKIDRLTRSLMDFAKMVEVFDAHQVSFVSVTQQFNTTNSMGRLTLNVLLSFAQFEREVTAERIRDKIAASKKKGMWMGGPLPLGYDVKDRKLIINEEEVQTVQHIFESYIEIKSVRALKRKLDEEGVVTKLRTSKDGTITGGKPFSRGNLYQLLHNPIYIGEIAHKGKTYPGQHEGIIDPETWQRVRETFKQNTQQRTTKRNQRSLHMLRGLLFDETGDRLTPSTNNKKHIRYPYYVSHRIMEKARANKVGWRLPAKQLDDIVLNIISNRLTNPKKLIDLLGDEAPTVDLHNELTKAAKEFMADLRSAAPHTQNDMLISFITRITVSRENVEIQLDAAKLRFLLMPETQPTGQKGPTLRIITVPHTLKRRWVETRIVLNADDQPKTERDPNLVKLIAEATYWMEQLTSGQFGSIEELSTHLNIDRNEISRTLPLAFLAPGIVASIIDGTQPVDLTARHLKRLPDLPVDWKEQRIALGF